MGAWGHGVFENDTALDFVVKTKRAKKANRLAVLRSAITGYVEYDNRRKLGTHIVVLSEIDKEALRESRKTTIAQFEASGIPVPYDTLTWLKSEQDCEEWIRELSKPTVDNGSDPAMILLASGYLAAGAAGLIPTFEECRCLSHLSPNDLSCLWADLRFSLNAVIANPLLADNWGEEYWQDFLGNVQRLANAIVTVK